jgi:hypothetical protein
MPVAAATASRIWPRVCGWPFAKAASVGRINVS